MARTKLLELRRTLLDAMVSKQMGPGELAGQAIEKISQAIDNGDPDQATALIKNLARMIPYEAGENPNGLSVYDAALLDRIEIMLGFSLDELRAENRTNTLVPRPKATPTPITNIRQRTGTSTILDIMGDDKIQGEALRRYIRRTVREALTALSRQ